ncbi:hypothetical protein AALP_AA3G222500 [Arabis alpina]|uniref:Uncharacterized protein n=1 Tax=Arabis alpina TaxID=50452 RepID=A0A087HAW7_ARAAL|nr:hypothetical protein AALP_AA3G222500 [Arabis alpina]
MEPPQQQQPSAAPLPLVATLEPALALHPLKKYKLNYTAVGLSLENSKHSLSRTSAFSLHLKTFWQLRC